MTKKIRTALIASGSGTDAYAIMSNQEQIPEIEVVMLISTKNGAGCLERATQCGVLSFTINGQGPNGAEFFNHDLAHALVEERIQLVFLVGCIVRIVPLAGVAYYNIHPANIEKYGGRGMYGLAPHKKVLEDIKDLIRRGRKSADDRFFTEVTVHEANRKFDSGYDLIKLQVEIPAKIIADFMDKNKIGEEAAAALQEYVLPYEWRLLPLAVKLAAIKLQEKI